MSRPSSQERSFFANYPNKEPSQLLYSSYGPSDYASTSTTPWDEFHPSPLSSPPLCYANHTSLSLAPPPSGSVAPSNSSARKELPSARPIDDFIFNDGDDLLPQLFQSGLSIYQGFSPRLYPLSDEDSIWTGFSDNGKPHNIRQPCHQTMESAPGQGASILMQMHPDDDDITTSPERRPYPTFFDDRLCRWSASPESVDTDLDDESSVLSLSLSLSSSMSSSSLSPPFSDSSELRQADEDEDEDEDEDILAISTLELSPSPLTPTTFPAARGGEDTEAEHEYENRYQHIEEYPSHLYNNSTHIQPSPPQHQRPLPAWEPQPTQSPSPRPLSPSDASPPSKYFREPTTLDAIRLPSPPPVSSPHKLGLEVGRSPQFQYAEEDEGHLPLPLLSPAQSPPLSPPPPTAALSDVGVEADYSLDALDLGLHSSSTSPFGLPSLRLSPPSSSSPPSSPSLVPQEPDSTEEPGLDSLGLGLRSPSLSSAELPHLFPSTSFYDFGDGPAPESPSRRRSTDLPPLLDDDSDGESSSFSPSLSSPVSDYQDLYPFRQPERRSHFLSLPGSDTDDDLIPSELASKNYVPDPTITVPTSSSYFSPSEKKARSLLMWDPSEGSIEYPAEGGFGFRGSNYHYPTPPRSPSPDLLDLDAKKIEELGGGEEGRRVWEARQRAVREESLGYYESAFGSGYGSGSGGSEREGGERRTLGRERRRELSALLRLKLGLGDGSSSEKTKKEKRGNVDDHAVGVSVSSKGRLPANRRWRRLRSQRQRTTTSPGLGNATPTTLSLPSSSTTTSTSRSSSSGMKPKITSMAQLVANMVFHRQQHPHSNTTGHMHDHSRPKRTTTPTRSRTWTAGAGAGGGAGGDPFSLNSSLSAAEVIAESAIAYTSLAKSQPLGMSKTPRSPLRQVTLPGELLDSDNSESDSEHDVVEENRDGEAHTNKTPTSTTLSPLFLCASPLSYSDAELEV
ncbi:hypothetical protein CPB84DRAFT_1752073 [Gymnopilus junonius]|uniref:Uncharacterized protein n=1 Tax=Gymnopilus junonius TaxID=109634 RepID=A0A9P5NDV6_GYMJU|nr:hypothetical protein CPB84DRAFT_1752073 [Gymnopilus junonius]